MIWKQWEEDQLKDHRYYSNAEMAELILPHRTEYSIQKRRKLLGLEYLVRCKKCSKPMRRSNRYDICPSCAKESKRINNIQIRYKEYQTGADRRGIKWDLDLVEFVELWNSQCTYCGVKIHGIGIDRIDSAAGYSVDNTVSCCTSCNVMKRSTDVDEWIASIKRIVNHYGKDKDS